VSWNNIDGILRLEENANSSGWVTVAWSINPVGSMNFSGKSAGSYSYRVRWHDYDDPNPNHWITVGGTATVAVTAPATPNTPSGPATDADGSFTISWGAVTGASSYQLQEQLNSGNWSTIHNAAGTSKARSGLADGTWSYRVRACSTVGCSGWSGTKSVVVQSNQPPNAVNDSATTNEDTPVTINVRSNDTDPNGNPLTITAVTQGSKGSVTINGGTTVTYTPSANLNGADSFTYTISDGNGGTDTATVSMTITPVNDAPNAVNDSATTDEDTAKNIAVRTNDTDIEGQTLTIAAVTQGTKGSVAINGGTTVTYTPNLNQNGSDSFTYTISDGNGGTDTAAVSMTITPVNDAPDAVNDSATTDEDTAITVAVRSNDTDVEGNTLTITGVTQGSNGSVAINGGTSVTYTPNANFNGSDSFTYTISDGNGGTDTATVSMTVSGTQDPPVATDDTETTAEDTPITISVRANDIEVDGDALTITAVTQGTKGSVMINGGTTVTYTPNLNQTDSDSFTYTISDGNGGTDTATVSMTITAVNDAPDAVNDSATTDEDTEITVAVRGNDTDVEGQTLTITAVTQGTKGSVVINGGTTVTYTPSLNQNGADSFTYTVSDGNGGTDTATVSMTITPVNDAPTAVDDADIEVDEDAAVNVDVLGNDADVENQTLSVTAVTQGTSGAVVINGGNDVTYTPAANFNGSDSFTYTISDGNGGTDTATVSVTVLPINDSPVAADDGASTDEDIAVTIAVRANDTDIDLDSLAVTAVTQGSNGTVVINGGLDVTYTPAANFNGSDSFTYTVGDGNGGSASATVNVTVEPVNDNPVAVDDEAEAAEDGNVVIQVRANDSDQENDTLSVTAVTQGSDGTVVINGGLDVSYTPDADFNGSDSFTYTISDGNGGSDTATVSVEVTPVNDTPTAVDDTATTNEDQSVTIDVRANDSDIDLDTLTIIEVMTQASNGTVVINSGLDVTYTPPPDFNGLDQFTYTISDGNGGTATASVLVTVESVNDAPNANDDTNIATQEDTSIAVFVVGNDSDPEGAALTVVDVTQAANGSVVISGPHYVTYLPSANFYGSDTFTYTVSDVIGATDTATVSINVTPVNDAPQAVDDESATDEDTAVTLAVRANDSDVDGDAFAITGATQGANGTVVVNGGLDVTYTPAANFNGSDSFTYTVGDGNGGTDTATVSVTVNPVNDAPVATDDLAATGEDTGTTIDARGNDTDVDLDSLTVTEVTQPANGVVVINGGLDVSYTPNGDFNGVDTFNYTVSDGTSTDTASVTVTVSAVNDAPVNTVSAPATFTADSTESLPGISVADVDAGTGEIEATLDVDMAALLTISTAGLTFTAGDGTADASMTFTGTLVAVNAALASLQVYSPQLGEATLTVITDDQGNTGSGGPKTDTDTVTITVEANVAPVIVSIPSVKVTVGQLYAYQPIATDANGHDVDFTLLDGPGGLTMDANGLVQWTPAGPLSGSQEVTIEANDGHGGSYRQTFSLCE
jgi:hypothetical protein